MGYKSKENICSPLKKRAGLKEQTPKVSIVNSHSGFHAWTKCGKAVVRETISMNSNFPPEQRKAEQKLSKPASLFRTNSRKHLKEMFPVLVAYAVCHPVLAE